VELLQDGSVAAVGTAVSALGNPDSPVGYGEYLRGPGLSSGWLGRQGSGPTPHEPLVNILCHSTSNAYYILWLASLTTDSEFHLYYDIYSSG
jgi:hypothetical protein